jgi:hypothetical protein
LIILKEIITYLFNWYKIRLRCCIQPSFIIFFGSLCYFILSISTYCPFYFHFLSYLVFMLFSMFSVYVIYVSMFSVPLINYIYLYLYMYFIYIKFSISYIFCNNYISCISYNNSKVLMVKNMCFY